MKRLIMFDYDGVIADSYDIFTEVFLHVCRKCGVKRLHTHRQLMRLFDDNLFEGMRNSGIDAPVIDRIVAALDAEIAASVDTVGLFEGMADTIKTIARHDDIFIITSNVSSVTDRVLKKNGVDCFRAVLGADIQQSKFKKIKQTIARCGDRPAYYVGDTLGDMKEGRRAGVQTIAVTWGWHDAARLQRGAPDFMVTTPRELCVLLSAAEPRGGVDTSSTRGQVTVA